MIEIMNMHNTKPEEPFDFYIDRRTPIGNPYFISNETRDEVCDKYEKYFNERIKITDNAFYNYIQGIKKTYLHFGKIRLFCWCAPQRCHGETIKKWLEESK